MLKKSVALFLVICLIVSMGVLFYVRNPYAPNDDLTAHLRTFAYEETNDAFLFSDDDAPVNVIFIPGGLVTSDAYLYMASELYLKGYQVSIVKPPLHLSILAPNQAKAYIETDMINVVIGHSLGGTVGSMVAYEETVDYLILLGSYSTKKITSTNVLSITASEDEVLNSDAFEDAKANIPTDARFEVIEGGNHAQFGWYTNQTGDGEATISLLQQQRDILYLITDFIGRDQESHRGD
jgi:pimeloyl-ACP methyl ester carboxylesterase